MKLKELRIKKGITQKDLACKLRVSNQTILNWENEIFEPSISQLKELSQILGVTIDYLVENKLSFSNSFHEFFNEFDKVNREKLLSFLLQNIK